MTGAEKRCRSAVMGMLAIYSFAVPAPSSEKGREKPPEEAQGGKEPREVSPGSFVGWVGDSMTVA